MILRHTFRLSGYIRQRVPQTGAERWTSPLSLRRNIPAKIPIFVDGVHLSGYYRSESQRHIQIIDHIILMHREVQSLISRQQARINLNEIKLQISKKIGPDRTHAYFSFTTKFLAKKLTKAAFNKFVLLVLGRGKISLHNNLIRSILNNAYETITPPPAGENFVLNQTEASAKTSVYGNETLSLLQPTTSATPNQCNGDILPRWLRTKMIQKSPLGSNGRVDKTQLADISINENDMLGPSDLKRSRQHDQSGFVGKPSKYPRRSFSLFHDHICLRRKRRLEAAAMEERKKIKISDLDSIKTSLRAPIGVSYRSSSVAGKMRFLHSALASNRDNEELYHTEDLKRSMERVAEAQRI